jgi:hypothetical protein
MNNLSGFWTREVADVPTTEHWAILSNRSITIPGDERSRTSPGHGYPEHTEQYVEYRVFRSEEAFLAALQAIPALRAGSVIGIHVPAVYTVKPAVKIEVSRG